MYSEYYEKEGKVICKMHYADLMKQFDEYDINAAHCNKNNTERIHKYRNMRSDDGFSGGTTKDFQSAPDMNPFLKAKEKILASQLDRKINDAIGYKPKRKRTNDEYDGDWSYDRQWDMKPFNRAFKLPIPNRFVTIDVDYSISARTDATAINEYGATVWAIVQILEDLGINVEVQISTKGRNMFYTTASQRKAVSNYSTFEIKKSTEYISPQALASVFRSVFYRIGMFATWIIEGDKHGLQADVGLGQPEPMEFNHVKYDKGVLYIAPDVHPKSDAIQKAIIEIVNGGKIS